MSGWIGVDLDGTLARYEGWRGETNIGEPVPAMLARVKAWLASGQEVRIFTARISSAHALPKWPPLDRGEPHERARQYHGVSGLSELSKKSSATRERDAMTETQSLLRWAELCEQATGPSRELDAEIVAEMHNAIVKRYPPTDDFGPKQRWQFWTRDGAHFLGNEAKWPVPAYTASLDAALTLVPEGWRWAALLRDTPLGLRTGEGHVHNGEMHMSGKYRGADVFAFTPALALCAAALRARAEAQP